MPLLKVNIDRQHPCAATQRDVRAALRHIPRSAPIVVCLHGYKFSPLEQAFDPHRHILSLMPESQSRKALSWPRALGFNGRNAAEGLCITVGWPARGSIWQAYEMARDVADGLARLIWDIDRPVSIIGHSLGARVALSAMPLLPAGAVSQLILLAAADFRSTAQEVLRSEAGKTCAFLNVTSRENDLYDLLAELALTPDHGRARSLGAGLGTQHPNWCDLQIDNAASRAALASLGFDIPAPDRAVCHWSPYLRAGLFDLYRTAIRHPEQLPLGLLKSLLPKAHSPRFSHLLRHIPRQLPLPFVRKASF